MELVADERGKEPREPRPRRESSAAGGDFVGELYG